MTEEQGQFINLWAFAEEPRFQNPGARLPHWKEIQTDFPHLIEPVERQRRRLFVSHRWDLPEHPDPTGWQLRAIQELGRHYNYHSPDTCFWYDYMSLPQRPRSSEESKIFAAGLNNIRRTVGDCENVCLISAAGSDRDRDLEAMLVRGWIVFELYIARSRMKRPLPLYERESAMIEFGRTQDGWDDVVPDIQAVAPTDTPEMLQAWLEKRGIGCTNGSDLSMLSGLLHEELTRVEHTGEHPPFAFDRSITLTSAEITQLGIVTSSRRSMRYPKLYMEADQYDPKSDRWTVRFCERLPLEQLGIDLDVSETLARRIDPATGLSPMYPGVRFSLSQDGKTIRAELA